NIFSKRNGNMAGAGSVSWIFTSKGYLLINKTEINEDDLFSISVDAGAEDVKVGDKNYEIFTEPKDFENVKNALKTKNITWETSDLTKIPNSTIKIVGNEAKQLLGLMEALEDQDDVQKVYANFDIPDDVLEKIAQDM
ncbi:MAG: YebC/PmpR family DNA-binding transcriptional regulator, partial [Candidatus Omnitrophica bacterium]|nr:YebC/PmpR family DNA-binding transcriptional regulator [Candidatus Omnitrophota bacterium]